MSKKDEQNVIAFTHKNFCNTFDIRDLLRFLMTLAMALAYREIGQLGT
jgi:hypothetical protein